MAQGTNEKNIILAVSSPKQNLTALLHNPAGIFLSALMLLGSLASEKKKRQKKKQIQESKLKKTANHIVSFLFNAL